MKIFIFHISSLGLLLRLVAVHVFGTLFAYLVYKRFTQLGDIYNPEYYAAHLATEGVNITSTIFTYFVYFKLGSVFPGFLAPMFLSIFIAIITWLAFRDVYNYLSRKLFWACNLFPHFLVWSGASSKEQLVILSGIIVINFAAKRSFTTKNLNISFIFVLIAMFILFFIRPNYFVIYFVIFTTALFSPWLSTIVSRRLSVGVWVLMFSLLIIGITAYLALTSTFFSEDVVSFMMRAQSYFLMLEGGSNRYWIQWNDIYDFLYNSLWGIPQGFIGPTLMESIAKPIQFPVFLEGLLHITILGYLFFELLQLAFKNRDLRVHILPYIFISFIIVLISYPYLVFNPGSGLRYKQAMHPVLIFYPLLILGYYRINVLMKTKIKKIPDEL